MDDTWDGIYAAYITGADGQGFVLLVFMAGIITGCDIAGVLFDGSYEADPSGLKGKLRVTTPPEIGLVQGVGTGPAGITYEVPLAISQAILNEPFFPIETPLGKVNVRLERLRKMEAAK